MDLVTQYPTRRERRFRPTRRSGFMLPLAAIKLRGVGESLKFNVLLTAVGIGTRKRSFRGPC